VTNTTTTPEEGDERLCLREDRNGQKEKGIAIGGKKKKRKKPCYGMRREIPKEHLKRRGGSST